MRNPGAPSHPVHPSIPGSPCLPTRAHRAAQPTSPPPPKPTKKPPRRASRVFLEKTLPAHETPTPFRLRIPTNRLGSLRSRGNPVAVCASGYVVPCGGPVRFDAPPNPPPPLHARLAGHARKPDAERVLYDQHRARGSIGRRGAGRRRHLQLPDVLHLLALLRHEHRNAGPGGPLLRRPRPRHGPHRRTPGNAHRRRRLVHFDVRPGLLRGPDPAAGRRLRRHGCAGRPLPGAQRIDRSRFRPSW